MADGGEGFAGRIDVISRTRGYGASVTDLLHSASLSIGYSATPSNHGIKHLSRCSSFSLAANALRVFYRLKCIATTLP